jgi:alpha-ketoglutarate-dependent taurine dioxygenase
LADGYAFVASLGPELAREARSRPIRFDQVPHAGANGQRAIPAPLFTESENGTPPILRYSYNVMRDNSLDAPVHGDPLRLDGVPPFNAELCRRGVTFMHEHGFGALPADGDLLIFDNWRILHARDSYSDSERHLTRYWVG